MTWTILITGGQQIMKNKTYETIENVYYAGTPQDWMKYEFREYELNPMPK